MMKVALPSSFNVASPVFMVAMMEEREVAVTFLPVEVCRSLRVNVISAVLRTPLQSRKRPLPWALFQWLFRL